MSARSAFAIGSVAYGMADFEMANHVADLRIVQSANAVDLFHDLIRSSSPAAS